LVCVRCVALWSACLMTPDRSTPPQSLSLSLSLPIPAPPPTTHPIKTQSPQSPPPQSPQHTHTNTNQPNQTVADDILDVTASTEALGKTAGKDLDMDKTTYPKLMGLDGARQEARRLVVEAKAALNPFGPKAAALLAIADYIVEREN
jgi:hypothetical protein